MIMSVASINLTHHLVAIDTHPGERIIHIACIREGLTYRKESICNIEKNIWSERTLNFRYFITKKTTLGKKQIKR
jgi:hypothetical protein